MSRALRITCQFSLAVGLAMFAAGFVPGLVHPAVMFVGFALCFGSAAALRGGLGAGDDGPVEPDEPFAGINPATGLRMTKAGVDVGGSPFGVDNSRRD